MRLNAYLARAGVASRRRSDELIKAGRVRVNGQAGELNTFVEGGDVVEVDGWRAAVIDMEARRVDRLRFTPLPSRQGDAARSRDEDEGAPA